MRKTNTKSKKGKSERGDQGNKNILLTWSLINHKLKDFYGNVQTRHSRPVFGQSGSGSRL